MKKLILCIIGESGSGKTTVAGYLEKKYGIHMLQSRTTRKPRYAAEDGHTFVSDEEFDTYNEEDMLAYTKFGEYRYCCLEQDLKTINSYVIDEFGFEMLKKKFNNKYHIMSIRVHRPYTNRLSYAGEERIIRDKDKFNMFDDDFTWVIQNHGGIKSLECQSDIVMAELFALSGFKCKMILFVKKLLRYFVFTI